MGRAARGHIALYWAVATRSFRRYATYRGATAAGVFTNTVFGFILAYVLLAVYAERGHVGRLDAVAAVTYTFVAQGLLTTVAAFGPIELADRIASGDVVSDLYRPLDLQALWLSQDVGRAGFQLVFRGVPPFLVGALVFHLRLPADAGVWAAFLLSLPVAVSIAFAFRFLVALTGFWLLDTRGLVQLSGLVFLFFSGLLLPLAFFPHGLRALAHALPFAAAVNLPIEVFLGQHRSWGQMAAVLADQLVWLAALLLAGRLVMARAWHRLVVQGG